MDVFKESTQLAPGVYLQASALNFRLHRRLPWEPAPCQDRWMASAELDVTRQMMAGAFYAGLAQRAQTATLAPGVAIATPISLLGHIYSLAASYQTTHATPPIMRRVAQRMNTCARYDVAQHCLHVAEEESGHDTLALLDLAALGLSAQTLVERLRPQNALALVEQFMRFADSDQPISVLGYAYTLERMALFNTASSIAAIEQEIPAGVNATRCLRVHSAIGNDTAHVAESLELISSLPSSDRAEIVRAVYITTSQQSALSPDYPGDDELRAVLNECGWAMAEPAQA